MTLTIAYRFANRQTEQFVEYFEDDLYEFHHNYGDITHTYVEDLFFNSGWDQPANHFPLININSIREYFDELAERAYYQRLDDLNG
jgi:hypothetical protein